MTRQANASTLLRGRQQTQRVPREGSKLRRLYDALRSGQEVRQGVDFNQRSFVDLRDYYGVELETKRGRRGYTRMVGEWDGDFFVPIERILQDDAQ